MARYEFNSPSGLDTLAQYRIDTASGSSSAATIQLSNTFADIPGALLWTDDAGKLPDFIGSAATLYAKRVQPGGATSGSPTTMTGILLDQSSGGGGGTVAYGTTAGTAAEGNDSRITGAAQKASNLSDLASAGSARTNLGLGGSATLAVGTGAGTVAAGDDSRVTGAAQKASNLSDVASASTSRSNLGLGTAATMTPATLAADATILAALQPRAVVDAKADFGVVANGATDNTSLAANATALQNFVNYCLTNNRAGRLPDGDIRIKNNGINFSQTHSWAIRGGGRGVTTITQYQDNVPILNLGTDSVSFMHSFHLGDFSLQYANTQSSSNTAAIPILFTACPYNGEFRGIRFINGYYGMKVASGIVPPWGTSWDDLMFEAGLTGGAMDWSGGIAGVPNNRWGRMTVTCTNMTDTIFKGIRGYNFRIGTLEFLNNANGVKLMQFAAGATVSVGTLKLEVATFSAGVILFEFSSGNFADIDEVRLVGSTPFVNAIPGGQSLIVVSTAGTTANSGRVHIGNLVADAFTSVTGAGAAYMLQASSGAPISVDRVSYDNTQFSLTNMVSAGSAEYVTVGNYVNGRISTDKGDADYTITLGDPNVVMFQTAFTASRNINLPSTNGDLFNGLYYEFIFVGAISGANTGVIKCGGTTIATVSTDGTVARVTYRRNAAGAAGGWLLTRLGPRTAAPADVQVFTGNGTWTKPTGAKVVQVRAFAGGGGGGAGRRGAAGSTRFGGGGGGGAGASSAVFDASILSSTASVVVGAAGTGAAAQSVDSTDGAAGSAGGSSSFGSYLWTGAGGGGGGGTAAAGTAGSGGSGSFAGIAAGAGASGAGGGGNNNVSGGAAGGAGGGGVTSGDTAANGGAGGTSRELGNSGGGTAGAASGGAGGNGNSATTGTGTPGHGGGGGAGNAAGAGGAGGNGGNYGAGGGGGGASLNGSNSGGGGNGGAGIVVVVSYF